MSPVAPAAEPVPTYEERVIGNRIRFLRDGLGLKQEELAPLVDASRPLISKWENGKSMPDAVQLRRLVRVLGCDYEAILGPVGVGELPAYVATAPLTVLTGGRRNGDRRQSSLPFLSLVPQEDR